MSEEQTPTLTAIDQIANGGHLLMLKASLPYLPWSTQRFMACYIKAMELSNILHFYQSAPDLQSCAMGAAAVSPAEILQDIRIYCSREEQEQIDQCQNLLQMIELYQTMQEMGNNPEGFKNFLSPEQQAIFETCQTIFQDSGKESV